MLGLEQFIIIGSGLLIITLGVTGFANITKRGTVWTRLFGEQGAKIFYVLVGVALIIFAFFI